LSKNTHGSTCQPVVIKYWSMRLILFLEPFCLSDNCPKKPKNLETRTQVLQNKTLVKNISVINEWRYFNLLLVSLDLISSLRKLSTKTTETYWPETLNLYAVPKEMEDLSILTLLTLKVVLMTLTKTLPINILESKDIYIFMRF
jgi:hypothetical protein